MRVSYQHTNVHSGNESTLLRFRTADGTRACILVDAGDGVDLDSLLADDEYLNAVLLTHAHIDHYLTLARNVRHSAPVYTSEATATILEHALPEAQKDNDLGDVSVALDALEPIDEWVPILNDLEVRPISAGHTPGGAGFVIRFRDESVGDDLLSGEQHILVTGDFTHRPCTVFPGLATSYPFEIDCLLLNVSTDDSYTTSLNESLETVLERAYAGSRVVVATSSLTGVHYATLLAHSTETLDRDLPITIVGQAAKLYNALECDAPGVDTQEVFDRVGDVLEDGGVTIGGPETPTTGSARRLFEAIDDDPAAVFVQLSTGDGDGFSDVRCTTKSFRLCNHPSLETVDRLVDELVPLEVVIKHASGNRLNQLQRRFDRCFTWGTNDEDVHRLYEDGQWKAPGWIAETTAQQIRRRQWEALQELSLASEASLSASQRQQVDLEAEGIDLEALETVFSRTSPDPYPQSTPDAPGDGDDEADVENPEERAIEEELLARLDAIDAKLERSEETVQARVLSGGEGEQFLELLERADLEPGAIVELTIRTSSRQ
ncbi:MBL fold metallo-hydrolase [Natronobiforma cellulositropha]|uniref:MBL fold metallo-hydrolase n=1 Tax=Natronobiforma cellulositropha TaxID=1679076 RepID=UPI0021D5D966|nr:MBL fold metallo-hydrolase [Natronobiforma cellulositropha]